LKTCSASLFVKSPKAACIFTTTKSLEVMLQFTGAGPSSIWNP
jgi:hypothetical protein